MRLRPRPPGSGRRLVGACHSSRTRARRRGGRASLCFPPAQPLLSLAAYRLPGGDHSAAGTSATGPATAEHAGPPLIGATVSGFRNAEFGYARQGQVRYRSARVRCEGDGEGRSQDRRRQQGRHCRTSDDETRSRGKEPIRSPAPGGAGTLYYLKKRRGRPRVRAAVAYR